MNKTNYILDILFKYYTKYPAYYLHGSFRSGYKYYDCNNRQISKEEYGICLAFYHKVFNLYKKYC